MIFRRGQAWSLYARGYTWLPVQPISLRPTREFVIRRVAEDWSDARRVLDMGCGVGQLALALAERFPGMEVTAVDPSPEMIDTARRDRSHPRIEYRQGRVEDVPGDPPFDLVVTTHAFPYVEDPVDFLRHLGRVVRPGGGILLAQACTESLWDALLLRAVRVTTGPADYAPSARVKGWMQQAGLRPLAVRPIPAPPGMASLRLIEAVRP
ncbi:class I SAM-dependent methyltransferase [Myxococcota bacterium]|nr:class I SAM-dependent methyltransferase [Myxococcota bacterium]